MANKSAFFSTEKLPADEQYRTGLCLYAGAMCLGSIRQYRTTGLFEVYVMNLNNDPIEGEFATFEQADQFAWVSSTSATLNNLDDPAARARLLEDVVPTRYNEIVEADVDASCVAIENGHRIRSVTSRFGRIYAIVGTRAARADLENAKEYARSLPTGTGAL